jgi:glycosyltransferase involved in cell wall biosynthesis
MFDPFEIGGPGSHLKNLSCALAELGCEVHILTRGKGKITSTIKSDNVFIHYNSSLFPWSSFDFMQGLTFCLTVARKIDRFCKVNKIDVVHGQSPSTFVYGLSRLRTFPFVVTLHGTSFGEISQSLNRPFTSNAFLNTSKTLFNQSFWAFMTLIEYQMADKVVAVSEATAEEAKLFYRLPKEKVVVIPNGVQINKSHSDSTPKFPELILSVGRLIWRKGFNYLIEAMPAIIASFPNAKLYIIGEGPERSNLQKQIEKLGLNNSVSILQNVSKLTLDSLFLKSAVYVQPSLYEPLATTTLEAMSFGKAIVATKVGGLPEAIKDGETGLLVEPGDSKQLSEAIRTLLSNKPLCENLSKKTIAWAEDKFSWGVLAKRTISMYENLLNDFSEKHDLSR